MSKRRIERVAEQLRREVAGILQYEVKDPRIGPVTVTGATVSPDLQQARLFVVLAGDEAERSETLQGLNAARAFIRSTLADRLELRRAPELRFEVDESLAYAVHIERLLEQVMPADDAPDAVDDADDDAAAAAADDFELEIEVELEDDELDDGDHDPDSNDDEGGAADATPPDDEIRDAPGGAGTRGG